MFGGRGGCGAESANGVDGAVSDAGGESEETLARRVAALKRVVAELQEDITTAVGRDIPLLKGAMRATVDAEINGIGKLPDTGRAFNRQVATYDERLEAVEQQVAALGDVAAEKTTKTQKLAAISAFAQSKRGGPSETVAVTADEIQGCVGVSRRYAYELIDAAADQLDGARVRAATDVQTSTGVEHKNKALLVDCEAVHGNDAGVNKLTTRTAADGVAESRTEPVEEDEPS